MMHRSLLVAILAVLAITMFGGGSAKADPLFFSNVVALQNGGSKTVDLFSNPGVTLIGPQITFRVDVSGALPSGGSDILQFTYLEAGSPPQVQQFAIPLFGTVQPPFSILFTSNSAGATVFGLPATLTVDLLNSNPDFIIPGGPNQGQLVNSQTYSFNVAQPVPEPVTLLGLATGLATLGLRRRRLKQ
jgi:hypothetical protein